MIKKRTSLLLFVALGIMAIITPLIVLFFGLAPGKIIYKSNCAGISIEGPLEQFGREGNKGDSVNAVESNGFVFLRWDDGETNKTRSDFFEKGYKTISAIGQFGLSDTDSLQLVSKKYNKPDLISYTEPINIQTSHVYDKDSVFDSSASIYVSPSYENSKGQPKKDYLIQSESCLFNNSKSKRWYLYSMYNDKTLLHSLLAFNLLNSFLPESDQRYFKLINLTFNETYLGLYLAVESNFDYYERVFQKQPKWEVAINKTSTNQYQDFSDDYFSYKTLSPLSDVGSAKEASNYIADLLTGSTNFVNLHNASLLFSICEIMKNNSLIENDLKLCKIDDYIYFDPFCSFALSSPMYKWYDYSPTGKTLFGKIFTNLTNQTSDFVTSIINEMLLDFDSQLNGSLSFLDSIRSSIAFDISIWPIKKNSVFGIPSELDFETREEHVSYYKQWLNQRVLWLKGDNK